MKKFSIIMPALFFSLSSFASACPQVQGFWESSIPHYGAYVSQPSCEALTISRFPGDAQSRIVLDGSWQCRNSNAGNPECFRGISTEAGKQILLSFTGFDSKCLKSEDWIFDGSDHLLSQGTVKCGDSETIPFKQSYSRTR